MKIYKALFISLLGVLFLSSNFVFAQNIMEEKVNFVAKKTRRAMTRISQEIKKEEDTGDYTLGKDDVVEVTVRRHPEFSGRFVIGANGKIQYPFIGDIELSGYTKLEAIQELTSTLSVYVESPEVDITIVEYNSKVVYVVGMVARPGRYAMRAEYMPVRDAVMAAGLPRENIASLRRAVIIRPIEEEKPLVKKVNLLSLLYGGNLKVNYDLKSGDIVYLPSTALYKISTVFAQIVDPFYRSATVYDAYDDIRDEEEED